MKGKEKMANGEFDIFCKRVCGKKGLFPRGQTSVVLVDYDSEFGRGHYKIVRPKGEDRNHYILHRDDVNLGIRTCRDQRQLINTGKLKHAGIPSWLAAPLYGLLKLYFDQVGFLDNSGSRSLVIPKVIIRGKSGPHIAENL